MATKPTLIQLSEKLGNIYEEICGLCDGKLEESTLSENQELLEKICDSFGNVLDRMDDIIGY